MLGIQESVHARASLQSEEHIASYISLYKGSSIVPKRLESQNIVFLAQIPNSVTYDRVTS